MLTRGHPASLHVGSVLREKQHRIRYGAQRVQHTRYTATVLIRSHPNALRCFAEAMHKNTQAHWNNDGDGRSKVKALTYATCI
jgi:hypothetical protein